MKEYRIQIEILGMFLILFSVGWQVLIESDLNDMKKDGEIYFINRKLDLIWGHLASEYSKKNNNPTDPFVSQNFRNAVEYFQKSGNELERIKDQIKITTIVKIILFSIGSLLIIYAKYLDYIQNLTPKK